MVENKYEITNQSISIDNRILYRIRAIKNIGLTVKIGDFGGYIEKESNLSQFGNCWIKSGMVYANSAVTGNSIIVNSVIEDSRVSGCSKVINSKVSGSEVSNSNLVQSHVRKSDINVVYMNEATAVKLISQRSNIANCEIRVSNIFFSEIKGGKIHNSTFIDVRFRNAFTENTNAEHAKFKCNSNVTRSSIYGNKLIIIEKDCRFDSKKITLKRKSTIQGIIISPTMTSDNVIVVDNYTDNYLW